MLNLKYTFGSYLELFKGFFILNDGFCFNINMIFKWNNTNIILTNIK